MKNKKILFLFIVGILLILGGLLLDQKKISVNPILSKITSTVTPKPSKITSNSIKGQRTVVISRILDGDTVKTDSGETIRYLGINAPEKGQPYSSQATAKNKELVLGKNVSLEFDVQTKDRYARTLAYVFIGNTFVNLEMVKQGVAVTETIQPNVKYQDQIVKAQQDARNNCLGIWENLCNKNTTQSCLKITAINADAPGDDNKNKNGEWIEFKNSCLNNISMKGWLLKDNSASNKYIFKDFTLVSQKNVILYSGCGQDSEEKLYWQCPEQKYATWNNSSDHAYLYNEKGELVFDYQY